MLSCYAEPWRVVTLPSRMMRDKPVTNAISFFRLLVHHRCLPARHVVIAAGDSRYVTAFTMAYGYAIILRCYTFKYCFAILPPPPPSTPTFAAVLPPSRHGFRCHHRCCRSSPAMFTTPRQRQRHVTPPTTAMNEKRRVPNRYRGHIVRMANKIRC